MISSGLTSFRSCILQRITFPVVFEDGLNPGLGGLTNSHSPAEGSVPTVRSRGGGAGEEALRRREEGRPRWFNEGNERKE